MFSLKKKKRKPERSGAEFAEKESSLSLSLSFSLLRLKVLFSKNKPIFFFFLLNPSAPQSVFLSKGNVVSTSFHLHAGGAVGAVFYHRMKIARLHYAGYKKNWYCLR